MYQVFESIWQGATQQYILLYAIEYSELGKAKAMAKKIKGVVKLNGTTCFDFRR